MLCPYCLEREADTQDHVIPEGLFDVAPPGGYIKVPACEACNNGHSRDEEYFLFMILAEATFTSAAANRVLDRMANDHRSGRRRRTGLVKAVQAKLKRSEIYSPGGIYLGRGAATELDTPRVNRVLSKMVRGLYFHKFGGPLPKDAGVFVDIKPEAEHLRLAPVQAALAAPPKHLADVFSYRVWALPGWEAYTSWALAFYDSVLAIGVTAQPHLLESSKVAERRRTRS
jgi:hypothetical protein